jgi:hypothetical protein
MNKKLYKAMGLPVQAAGAASLRSGRDHTFLILGADFGFTIKGEHHKQGRQAARIGFGARRATGGRSLLCPSGISGINARAARPFADVAPTARRPARLIRIVN